MIGRRVIVVTDSDGVLEVFGPFEGDELLSAKSDLESWVAGCGDPFVELLDMPLNGSDALGTWLLDPEEFYGVGGPLRD